MFIRTILSHFPHYNNSKGENINANTLNSAATKAFSQCLIMLAITKFWLNMGNRPPLTNKYLYVIYRKYTPKRIQLHFIFVSVLNAAQRSISTSGEMLLLSDAISR